MSAALERTHVRSLDGVRGLAIALVLLYHGWTFTQHSNGFGIGFALDHVRQIGWAGVDVFFVLSGFLITGILLESRDKPRYWRNFLIRRGLRIFPLYYAVLVAILIGSLVSPELRRGGIANIWVNFLYLTNFWVATVGENKVPLDSAWSLAIEEQFYLVFPAVVKLVTRRMLTYVLIGIVVAAPLLRFLTWEYGAQPVLGPYALPYCRLDALAIGALLRLAFEERAEVELALLRRVAPVLCVAAVAFLYTSSRKELPFIVAGYSLTALATASLIACLLAARAGSPLRRVFEAGPLVYIGKISYGLYLFHLIVRLVVTQALARVFAKEDLGGTLYCTCQLVAMVVLTIAVAALSFRYFEQPILRLKDRWAPASR
ncbi:MAG: acyltransferase [Deltaproteobacteria bacterium]|nr:acyltransferase [Deltaproteobacteria bacterium]